MATYFGINAKEGVTRGNILTIFLLNFMLILIADDYMALQSGLLIDPNYYDLDVDEATTLQNRTKMVAQFPGFLMIFLGGYIYDIFGRRFSVYTLLTIGGFTMAFFPLGAPDKKMYAICFVIFGVCVSPLSVAPLIQDYVCKDSYGRAMAFQLMGVCFGVCLSLGVLFNFTKNIDP
jgi:MFS family permease